MGSSSRSTTTSSNTSTQNTRNLQLAQQDFQGVAVGGNDRSNITVTATDHGAIDAGLSLGRAGLDAGADAFRGALDLGHGALALGGTAIREVAGVNARSLDFSGQVLEAGLYSVDHAAALLAEHAGLTVREIADVNAAALAYNESVSKHAMDFIDNLSRSDDAMNTQAIVKWGIGGAVLIAALMMLR